MIFEVIEVIDVGPQGAKGDKGDSQAIVTVVAGEPILVGQPIYVSPADNLAYRARADVYVKTQVIGLAHAAAATGFAFNVDISSSQSPDWTLISGTAALTPGSLYFLGLSPGTITTIAPTSQTQTIVRIGTASGPSAILINSGYRYLL